MIEMQQAEKSIDQRIEKSPQKNGEVARLLLNADLLLKYQEVDLALNLIREACNRDSRNPIVLDKLAEALSHKGRKEEELKVRFQIKNIFSDFYSTYKYADCLYQMGKDDLALQNYFEALALMGENADYLFQIYKNIGNIYVKILDFEAAEEYYNKAYTLNSESDTLLVNFGTLEIQKKDLDKALFCFRKALGVNAKNDKAWVGLALIHNEFGDRDLAWANLEKSLDLNPINRTAALLIANWAQRDSCYEKGLYYLKKYLIEENFDEEASLVLIQFLCIGNRFAEALCEVEKSLAWNPDNKKMYELRKELRVKNG